MIEGSKLDLHPSWSLSSGGFRECNRMSVPICQPVIVLCRASLIKWCTLTLVWICSHHLKTKVKFS